MHDQVSQRHRRTLASSAVAPLDHIGPCADPRDSLVVEEQPTLQACRRGDSHVVVPVVAHHGRQLVLGLLTRQPTHL